VTQLALSPILDQSVRELSGGQRQRLNAAAAFLFIPDLLLLDEPTAGLDPIASGILKDRIRQVRDEGRAVIITSHILSELEELADTIVFLHEGRVRWSGSLDALLSGTNAPTLERAIATLMLAESAAASNGRGVAP
jgi:Cu-processing system ATP-binding protein